MDLLRALGGIDPATISESTLTTLTAQLANIDENAVKMGSMAAGQFVGWLQAVAAAAQAAQTLRSDSDNTDLKTELETKTAQARACLAGIQPGALAETKAMNTFPQAALDVFLAVSLLLPPPLDTGGATSPTHGTRFVFKASRSPYHVPKTREERSKVARRMVENFERSTKLPTSTKTPQKNKTKEPSRDERNVKVARLLASHNLSQLLSQFDPASLQMEKVELIAPTAEAIDLEHVAMTSKALHVLATWLQKATALSKLSAEAPTEESLADLNEAKQKALDDLNAEGGNLTGIENLVEIEKLSQADAGHLRGRV
jgi:hypothetical protein